MFLAAFTSALQAKLQAVHTKRAWLSRDFASTCPHAEQRWLLNAGLTFSTLPGALSISRCTIRPQPDRKISRFIFRGWFGVFAAQWQCMPVRDVIHVGCGDG
jgi:hypothetical protein